MAGGAARLLHPSSTRPPQGASGLSAPCRWALDAAWPARMLLQLRPGAACRPAVRCIKHVCACHTRPAWPLHPHPPSRISACTPAPSRQCASVAPMAKAGSGGQAAGNANTILAAVAGAAALPLLKLLRGGLRGVCGSREVEERSTTSSAGGGAAAYETRKAVDEYLQFHFGAASDIMPYPQGPRVGRDGGALACVPAAALRPR